MCAKPRYYRILTDIRVILLIVLGQLLLYWVKLRTQRYTETNCILVM